MIAKVKPHRAGRVKGESKGVAIELDVALCWAVIVQQVGCSSSGCSTALCSVRIAAEQCEVTGCGTALGSALQQYNLFYVACYCYVNFFLVTHALWC